MDHPYEMDGYHQSSEQHLLSGAAHTAGGAQLADSIERGGAQIEETLSRLNCRYSSLFFLAGWAVVIAGIMSCFMSLLGLQLATFVNSIFLTGFGIAALLLDIPGSPRWAGPHRRSVRKYARFLTRMTGKSLWFLYLGCMVAVCAWPSSHHYNNATKRGSGLQLILAILLSSFVVIVALIGLFVALRKSLRLERIRKHVQANYSGNWGEVYRKYAINDPAHGMQYEEFNRLASDFSGGRVLFDLADLNLIFSALDDHQKAAINELEFGVWAAAEDHMTFL